VPGETACTVGDIEVKGGNEGYNVYTFDPPALCSEGLVTPTRQEISHVDICLIECCECTGAGSCGTAENTCGPKNSRCGLIRRADTGKCFCTAPDQRIPDLLACGAGDTCPAGFACSTACTDPLVKKCWKACPA
jgi:hypothetical protein